MFRIRMSAGMPTRPAAIKALLPHELWVSSCGPSGLGITNCIASLQFYPIIQVGPPFHCIFHITWA